MRETYQIVSQEVIDKVLCVGELSLDGTVRAVNGVLSMTMMAKHQGFTQIIVPADNAI